MELNADKLKEKGENEFGEQTEEAASTGIIPRFYASRDCKKAYMVRQYRIPLHGFVLHSR